MALPLTDVQTGNVFSFQASPERLPKTSYHVASVVHVNVAEKKAKYLRYAQSKFTSFDDVKRVMVY